MTKLALFDLDGTLISTQGVGMRAMAAAGAGLWGEKFHFEGVVSAGGLDPLLFRVAAERCGVEYVRCQKGGLTERCGESLHGGAVVFRVVHAVSDELKVGQYRSAG